MIRAFAMIAFAAALWIIDPVVASAMERHPALVGFSMTPWLWVAALIGGISLSLLAALAVLWLMIVGNRPDRERGK